MTRKYTANEVINKTRELTNQPEVINRRGSQTSDEIVSSLVEFVFRSLNSDIDSVYSLIKLFSSEQIAICSEAVSKLSELYDLAPSVSREPEQLDERTLSQIQQTADAAYFNQGALREEAIRSLNSLIERFVSTGSSGRSPQYAKERCLKLLVECVALTEAIQQQASRFNTIVDDYSNARFEPTAVQNNLTRTNRALSLLGNNLEDPNETKMVLAVAHGLLNQANTPKRDITSPKYSGPVTMLPGPSASMLGATVPLILHREEFRSEQDVSPEASINYTGPSENLITVSGSLSPQPSLKHNIDEGLLRRTESGVLLPASSETAVGGPRYLASHNELIGGTLLGDTQHESSISYDALNSSFNTVNSAVFVPFLKTYVVPGSVRISLRTGSINVDAWNLYLVSLPIPYADIVSPEVSPSDFFVPNSVDIVDDGAGNLTSVDGTISFGTITYSKGALLIHSENEDIDLTSDVTITYDYMPYYEGRSYVAETGSLSGDGQFLYWDSFSMWLGNTVDSTPVTYVSEPVVPATNIETLDDLQAALGRLVDVSRSASTFTFLGPYGGSAARLSFPYRASSEWNSAAFAPVWTSVPQDFNQALGLTQSSRRESFGKDTPLSEVLSSSDLLMIGVDRKPVSSSMTFSYQPSGLITTSGGIDDVEIGDDVHVTSPTNCHVKVVGKGEEGLVVSPEVPLPIKESSSDELEDSVDIIASISRDRVALTSQSNDPSIMLSVTDSGLGFSGEAQAITSRILLDQNVTITGAATAFGYTIKAGDTIVERSGDAARPIGIVKSVTGNEIDISISTGSYTYPYAEIDVYSMGWSKYKLCAAPIKRLSDALYNQLYSDEILVKGVSYLNSGSGQNAFYQAILTLRDNISELRNQYLNYDAHVVNTANGLLSYFRQDKIGAVTELIEQCRFSEIADLTPATLAARSSVEQLMSEASNLMGGDMTYWHRDEGINLSNDYLSESDHPPGVSRLIDFEDVEEP